MRRAAFVLLLIAGCALAACRPSPPDPEQPPQPQAAAQPSPATG